MPEKGYQQFASEYPPEANSGARIVTECPKTTLGVRRTPRITPQLSGRAGYLSYELSPLYFIILFLPRIKQEPPRPTQLRRSHSSATAATMPPIIPAAAVCLGAKFPVPEGVVSVAWEPPAVGFAVLVAPELAAVPVAVAQATVEGTLTPLALQSPWATPMAASWSFVSQAEGRGKTRG